MDDSDDEAPLLVTLDEPEDAAIPAPQPSSSKPKIASAEDTSDLPPCPVTILSGFLGSGKTTLIQYILNSPQHKKRIAVIENEFGEGLAIETLIAKDGLDNSSLSDFIELPNGCVCCTVKDSLVETLENLLMKRRDLDYIIIEASGMANPGPIASVFWLDEELESRLRLDGVVTLVDAYRITQQLKETQEASQQIAYADRILLNKIDLVESTGGSTDQALTALRQINPAAQIRNTTFSQVPDLEWILDANCYDERYQTGKLSETVEKLVAEIATNDNDGDNHHSHDHEHHHDHQSEECATCQQQLQKDQEHSHTSAVSTHAFREKGTMDLEKLNSWLASVLWPNQDEKDEVLRARLEKSLAVDDNKEGDIAAAKAKEEEEKDQQQVFRIKGVCSIRCQKEKTEEKEWVSYCDPETGVDKRRFIVQAVYDIWDIHPSSDMFDLEERECKLVVIGRHLQRSELLQGFRACLI